ncbi:hypothetical protein JOH50_001748 [Rhizobium leguminosarum]|uniref:hypothetical protein n=1 Tax=Rhizobium leguminosarum TaxID=384 RepID=UPI001AE48388|nr:hypothetical protein [Rhizobium leguminosarum]MBP2486021.1 hypothetical protein [Rhizobium leguminosarum]
MNTGENRVAHFLNERLVEADSIEGESKFLDSKLFKMVLLGNAKLPLDLVEEAALALHCDARQLFRMAAGQFYDEDAICLFERMLGPPLTNEEQMWLKEIRSANGGHVSAPSGMAKRLVRALAKAPA